MKPPLPWKITDDTPENKDGKIRQKEQSLSANCPRKIRIVILRQNH